MRDAGALASSATGADGAEARARVLDYAGVSPGTRDLNRTVMTARYELQNGDCRGAAQAAGEAAAFAAAIDPRAASPPAADPERYRNATVVDASGNAVGRIVRFANDRVRIERGPFKHLLGFIRLADGQR